MPPVHRETALPRASPSLCGSSHWEGQENTKDLPVMKAPDFLSCYELLLLSGAQAAHSPPCHCSLSKCTGKQSCGICQSEARTQLGLSSRRRDSYFSGQIGLEQGGMVLK